MLLTMPTTDLQYPNIDAVRSQESTTPGPSRAVAVEGLVVPQPPPLPPSLRPQLCPGQLAAVYPRVRGAGVRHGRVHSSDDFAAVRLARPPPQRQRVRRQVPPHLLSSSRQWG
jgi:hypothetical protein